MHNDRTMHTQCFSCWLLYCCLQMKASIVSFCCCCLLLLAPCYVAAAPIAAVLQVLATPVGCTAFAAAEFTPAVGPYCSWLLIVATTGLLSLRFNQNSPKDTDHLISRGGYAFYSTSMNFFDKTKLHYRLAILNEMKIHNQIAPLDHIIFRTFVLLTYIWARQFLLFVPAVGSCLSLLAPTIGSYSFLLAAAAQNHALSAGFS